MYEAYPLQWPDGYKRHSGNRYNSKFKQGMEASQRFLRDEVARLGGKDLVVSSNLPIRNDGQLYTDWMRRKIEDPGVAIYFKYKGQSISMCCDQYPAVWENIYALGKGIEALRGMERWGVSDFLERAFTGFTALPNSSSVIVQPCIWEVLGLNVKPDTVEAVHIAYKRQAMQVHPDRGGSTSDFQLLQECYERAKKFYN